MRQIYISPRNMRIWIGIILFCLLTVGVYTVIKHMPEPTTIVDQPIPLLDGSITDPSGVNSGQQSTETVIVPTTQVDKAFPEKIVARETLSQSLNTESKRILGQYTFEQNGAIAMGEFQQGVSGEVKISPDGIVAKNVNGDTTFALDGTTGDATFRGTVEAAGFTIADETGLHSVNNFPIDTVTAPNLTTTSGVTADIPGASLSFTLQRSTRIIIPVSFRVTVNTPDPYEAWVFLTDETNTIIGDEFIVAFEPSYAGGFGSATLSQSRTFIQQFTAGTHTIKLRCYVLGSISHTFSAINLSYIILGN